MGTSFGLGGSTKDVDDGLEDADAVVRVANPLVTDTCAAGAVAGFEDIGALDVVDAHSQLV
jgi:hypothetical protein